MELIATFAFTLLSFGLCSIEDALKGSCFDNRSRLHCNDPFNFKPRCHFELRRPCIETTCIFDIVAADNVKPCEAIRIQCIPFKVPSTCKVVRKYVEKTLDYIRCKLNKCDYQKIKCDAEMILRIIDCNLNGCPKEYALFTASALHNTSFFKYFALHCDKSKYMPRGLLMINNIANYKKLDAVSKYKRNYVRYPTRLACKLKEDIINTIRFWKSIMCRRPMTFAGMMDALNTVSWGTYKHSDGTCMPADLKNRKEIYEDLLRRYKK